MTRFRVPMSTATAVLGAFIAIAAGHRAQAQDNAPTPQQKAIADILAHAFHGDVWVIMPQL